MLSGRNLKTEKRSFVLRATASRLEKGLLAIPKMYTNLFPEISCDVQVFFDDGNQIETKAYLPCNEKVKEARLFGLSRWFSERKVIPNDAITIAVEGDGVYRLSLDRYMRARRESSAREKLYAASTEEFASAEIDVLAKIAKRGRRKTAIQEILHISKDTTWEQRRRVTIAEADRNEGVPPGLRALLRELHEGKCQVCSFTFAKKDGNPYFEIHHVDPDMGHQPMNLLVLCANCHARFEHANISDLELRKGWLIALKINGKRFEINQPVLQDPKNDAASYLCAILLAIQTGLALGGCV